MPTIISPAFISGSQSPRLKSLPPLSLYIHVPWCLKKCPYCDFNSHEVRGQVSDLPESEYVAALMRDLEAALPLVWGRKVVSIFFGGGTPSLFSAQVHRYDSVGRPGFAASGTGCRGDAGSQSGNVRGTEIR